MGIKITREDSFAWLTISIEEVKVLLEIGDYDVYCLYPDDTEALVYDISEVSDDNIYGIEIGFIK